MMHKLILGKLKGLKANFKDDRDFSLFLIAGFFSGIAGGIATTVFNNFLNDNYSLSAIGRGAVEVPRELPGLLIMIILALLSFMGDTRISALGMVFASIGVFGLGLFSSSFSTMIVFMMLFSLGTHIFMPISPSIGMSLSTKEQYGLRLGKYNSIVLLATIFGYALVWIGFSNLKFNYTVTFLISTFFYILAGITLLLMKKSKPHHSKFKIIFRKRYTLYYILCIVNGARKQIFLTFAPWVLVKIFDINPQTFAILGVIIALISIFTRTIIGKAIDTKGERFILSIEAVVLFVLCMGYAFATDIFPTSIALVVVAVCYILDNSMSTVEMARSTYLKKIAVEASDVTHTLATGTSLDHLVSMSIPVVGGLLWSYVGFKYVFIIAAAIALLNLFLSLKINIFNKET